MLMKMCVLGVRKRDRCGLMKDKVVYVNDRFGIEDFRKEERRLRTGN